MSDADGKVAELAAKIRERDERDRTMDDRMKWALRTLQPLIQDLPAAETFLLSPQSVEAWRVIRDGDPDIFLVYVGAVRARCGNNIAFLVQNRVGAPSLRPGGSQPLQGFTTTDIWSGYTPPQYLVKRLLGPSEVTVLFGQSGHFKSAIAVDLALCVASDRQFHGVKTRNAGVLYVAGEGHGGLRKRIRAWLIAHDFNAASEQPALFVTEQGADLIGNPAQLRLTVEQAVKTLGVPIELCVIDTLAANFGEGDENHASDMGLAIANAKQAAPGSSVLLVHHTGHFQETRERGSYALVAAADYRLCATYDTASQRVEVRWLKCKDDERPEPISFTWRTINLEWQDADGEELSSVVLERAAWEAETNTRGSMGKNQALAFRVLQRLYDLRVRYQRSQSNSEDEAIVLRSAWRTECEKAGLERNRFAEAVKALLDKGCVAIEGEQVRPIKARVSASE